MKFYKKLATLGVIGVLTVEQCMSAFAANISYGYYARKESGGSTASHITTILHGSMAGNTSAYLSLTIRGVYSSRGGPEKKTDPVVNINDRTMSTGISASMTITQIVPGYDNYYAVECSGMYKTTPTGRFQSAGGSIINV